MKHRPGHSMPAAPVVTRWPARARSRLTLPPRRGAGLLECLIALTICSALLAAVGVALRFSFDAVELNDHFSRATQASRVTINQLLLEIRQAASVNVSAGGTQLDVIRPEANRAPNEVYRRYTYDAAGRRLTLQLFYAGGTSGQLYTLANNVESAKFGPAETAPASSVVVRVPVVIHVKVGRSEIVLDGTAGPRQATTY